MLYFLLILWAASIVLSLINILPYNPLHILLSGIYLAIICNLANYGIAKVVGARTNLESASITALILTLIVGPFALQGNVLVLTFIGVVAMASKYILAIKKKHIFNPTAASVFLSAVLLGSGASWWIGSIYTLPIIVLGGLLILVKIKRFELVVSFLVIYFLNTILFGRGVTINSFLAPSIWFFAFVMLVEPLTAPSTKNKQIIFGAFVGLVYILLAKIAPGYAYGLETSLLAGNLLSTVISPTFNLVMVFKEKKQVAANTWSFYFEPMSKLSFTPGQYLEWTLPHKGADGRGTRRYFTISSAPEEKEVMLTIRIAEKGSSFKSALMSMKKGSALTAGSPQGDFVLPKDKSLPLVFIAGGIGVTPFRSMVKHLHSQGDKRDIVLLYSNRQGSDVAFQKLFDKAKSIGIKTIYINTESDGHIDDKMIKRLIPDHQKRMFYISGPQPMVKIFEDMLGKLGVKKIKTDFFPGYT
jgi:ferredoxin-NADP reductase